MISVLPFLSSGFVPTDTMPFVLRIFAENQPMSPIINSVRSLFLNEPDVNGVLYLAFIWCIGLSIVFCASALRVYKRRVTL